PPACTASPTTAALVLRSCPLTSRLLGAAEKPGACPAAAPEGLIAPCSFPCLEDKDCLGAQKCCPLGCGSACLDPGSPQGSCGPTVQPGSFRERCRADSDCPGAQKCCNSSCGQQSINCVPNFPQMPHVVLERP
uniref:WAP domain-containing protein n=1 Tax=Junco hyemalis TaxID=40217 RepID=A0A8C5IDT6_JUNHY